MEYCVAFALANRKLMMERIEEIIAEALPNATFEPMINIAHNYAAWEEHFGENVIVHRKGAVQPARRNRYYSGITRHTFLYSRGIR